MSKAPSIVQAEKQWRALSVRIGLVVKELLDAKGVTRTQFAEEIHYPSSNLLTIFNTDTQPGGGEKTQNRYWSMPLLLLTARYFKLPVYALIRAAIEYDEAPGQSTLVRTFRTQTRLAEIAEIAEEKHKLREAFNKLRDEEDRLNGDK